VRDSDPRDRRRAGFVYLLHFDVPYWHAKHYSGFTAAPNGARWESHLIGTGARLLRVLAALGIGWHPVRVWRGTRDDERRLKNLGGATRVCPVCTPRPWPCRWMHELERADYDPSAPAQTSGLLPNAGQLGSDKRPAPAAQS
jgi:hypothetical protein